MLDFMDIIFIHLNIMLHNVILVGGHFRSLLSVVFFTIFYFANMAVRYHLGLKKQGDFSVFFLFFFFFMILLYLLWILLFFVDIHEGHYC